MTTFQRARRLYFLRGSATTLTVCTLLMLLSALADRITQ
jgi:hypothetical protein